MSYFSGLVQNEWMKTTSKRQVPFYLLFLFVMITGVAFILWFAMDRDGNGTGALDYVDMMTRAAAAISMVFLMVVSAQTITDEFKDGTIKQLLIRPASRTMILMSKLVNLMVIALVIYLAILVLSYLVGFILFHGENSTTLGAVLESVLFSLPELFFYSLLAFMIGVLTRSLGLSIAVPILTQMMVAPMASLLANESWYMLLIFPNVDWTPYVTPGASLPYAGASIGLSALIYFIYMMIMLLVTILVFNKRDVQ